jgi:hypothetical protein
MRWLLATAVAGSTVPLAGAAPANADTPGCVTPQEWRHVYIIPDDTGSGPGSGATMRRVHRVFDTVGSRVLYDKLYGDFRYQVRRYEKCARPGFYRVTYHRYLIHGDGSAWDSYWG